MGVVLLASGAVRFAAARFLLGWDLAGELAMQATAGFGKWITNPENGIGIAYGHKRQSGDELGVFWVRLATKRSSKKFPLAVFKMPGSSQTCCVGRNCHFPACVI